MSELTIEINGKPKTFYLDQPNPPSEAQVLEIKRVFLSQNPGWGAVATPGKRPPAMQGNIGFGQQNEGSFAPVNPFANTIEQGGQKVDPKQVKAAQQQALKMVGNPMLAGVQGKPPAKQVQGYVPPELKKILNPPKIGRPLDPNNPKDRAIIDKAGRDEYKQKHKTDLKGGTLALRDVIGSQTGLVTVKWQGKGPAYEAEVEGQTVMAPSLPALEAKIRQVYQDIEGRRLSPRNDPGLPDGKPKKEPPTPRRRLTDKEQYEAFQKQVEDIGKTIAPIIGTVGRVLNPARALVGNQLEEAEGQFAANILATPAQVMAWSDVVGSKDNSFTDFEKQGALLNILGTIATTAVTPGGPSLIDDAIRAFKGGNPSKLMSALDKLDLPPAQKATVKQYVKENPAMFKGFKENVSPPKAKPVADYEVTPKGETKKTATRVDEGSEPVPIRAEAKPAQAVWRNQDTDLPVTLTGRVETYKDGRKFAEVEIDGRKSFVPEDEIVKPPPVATPKTPEASVKPGASSFKEPWQMSKADFVGDGLNPLRRELADLDAKIQDAERTRDAAYGNAQIRTTVGIKNKVNVRRNDAAFTGPERATQSVNALREQRGKIARQIAIAEGRSVGRLTPADVQFKKSLEHRPKAQSAIHRDQVADALAQGKPVPQSVLDEYPDLKPPQKTVQAPEVKEAPKVEAPKVETPKVEPPDITGVAKQVTNRDPIKGRTKVDIAEAGKARLAEDADYVKKAVERVNTKGGAMDADELSASGYRLRQIANDESAIRGEMEKGPDLPELARLNKRMEELETEREAILSATDSSLHRSFYETGTAAQVVYKKDYSLGMLKAKAKAALLKTVEVVPKHIEAKLTDFSKTVDKLNADLKAAQAEIARLTTKAPKTGTKERNVINLKTYFAKNAGQTTPLQGKTNKKAGAIYTLPDETKDAMRNMRSLARHLAMEGAESLDEIVDGIRKEIGISVPDETIYSMLSDRYRRYMLESDVTKMKADQYLREIQRASEFKLKSPMQKGVMIAKDLLGASSRSMQAGFDISAPFIQGRKGLAANPVGWFKAWESQIKALRSGDEVALKRLAEMEKHPLWSRAKAAGIDKVLRVPGGRFTAQEEAFASNFMRMASDTMDQKGKIGKYNPVNLYIKGLQNSDAAFSAFLNDLTWDTFVRWARANPDDPAHLRDMVHNLGVIYGRGHGKVAEAIGRSGAGDVLFAPRYVLSQFQYAGTPVRAFTAFETAAGRNKALQVYGTQAAFYGTLVAMAKLAGWEVDSDLRSSTFGSVVIGKRRFDLFGKEAQAYRLFAQMFFGKINQKNEYTKPSLPEAAKTLGMFGINKVAPLPRLPLDVAFGSYDADKGPVEFTPAEFGKRYLPIWVQNTLESGDMKTVPLALMGMDIQKDKKVELTLEQKTKSYPMELPKIRQKLDPLGRPLDTKKDLESAKVMDELKRLGMQVEPAKKTEKETEAEWRIRTTKQGEAVKKALFELMQHPEYKNAVPTIKRELIREEIRTTKAEFNAEFNAKERERKDEENTKRIEREMATGAR